MINPAASQSQRIDDLTPGALAHDDTPLGGDLYVKDAYKSFGVTKALNGASFRAHVGEIHAIVGGNGCGKSTLAKVMSGVISVDRGKVSVLGHQPKSPAEARAIGVATVFQEVMVADEATITENLFAGSDGLWSRSMTRRDKVAQARDLMKDLTGSDMDPERLAHGLSLGVKAWITIGRALLCHPKLLILDESSAALDFDSTERLFAKMRQLRDRGAAILIVTHRIAELVRISDRATVMRDGRDVGVLERSDVTEKNLLALMTGRSDAHEKGGGRVAAEPGTRVVLKVAGMRVWPEAAAVDFDLRAGEIVGVTGLEGHGQDAFVRILAGVSQAAHSVPLISIAGSPAATEIRSLEQAKQHGIAFVSGDRKREGILPNMSIFENLLIALYGSPTYGGKAGFIDWGSLNGIFEWEVERLSIKTGPRTNLITSLSGGNQQKVLIARAFATQPRILVLNDPARGIDVGAKQELYHHLREFVAEGKSVVYMSSELEEFIGLCPRVAVFRNGSIFDTFVGDEIEPVGILAGMFGQPRDGASTAPRPRSLERLPPVPRMRQSYAQTAGAASTTLSRAQRGDRA